MSSIKTNVYGAAFEYVLEDHKRRELHAAADKELATEKHVHAVYSSVLIWLDSFPPSASAFISGS